MRRKWQIRPQGKFGQHCTPQSRTSRGENVCKAIIEQRAFELRSPRITHAVPNGSVILTTSSPRLELRTIRKRMYKSTRIDASRILSGPGVANDGTQPEFRTVVLRSSQMFKFKGYVPNSSYTVECRRSTRWPNSPLSHTYFTNHPALPTVFPAVSSRRRVHFHCTAVHPETLYVTGVQDR